jgi:hypothetical protein
MTGIFFYTSLIVMSLIISLWAFLKNKKKWSVIWFYFFSVGLAYIGDYIILILLNAYEYRPGMLPEPYRDNIVGHIISNAFVLPSAALLVAVFSLGYLWIFILSLIYTLMDYIFNQLNIYEHHWWKTYMTTFALFIYLSVTKFWYRYVQGKKQGLIRYPTFFFIAFSLTTSSLFLLTIVLQKIRFQIGRVDHPIWDNTIAYPLYTSLISIVYVVVFCIVRTKRWKILWLLLLPLFDGLLVYRGIIQLLNDWSIWKMGAIHLVLISIFVVLKKYSISREFR